MSDPSRVPLRVVPLASGSGGNATLVEGAVEGEIVRALVDCGLSANEVESRLRSVGREPESIDWIFVTHRHRDHVAGVRDFVRRHRARVLCTPRAQKSLGTELHKRTRVIRLGTYEWCGKARSGPGLKVHYHRVPHDAPETAALRIENGGAVYGHLTDAGHVPDDLVAFLEGCDALLLESNHDRDRLFEGDDPPHLKRRIASPEGHLSNEQAREVLDRLVGVRLRHVWLAHLSQRNNSVEAVLDMLKPVRQADPGLSICILSQDHPAAPVELLGESDAPVCIGVCQADSTGRCIGCGRT